MPRGLSAAVKSEDSSNLRQQVRFIMFSRHFLRIIRQSIQMVYPVFSHVVSFRRVEGPNRTLVSKTSATCSHHGRRSVFRARAVEQLEMVRKQNLATNKAFLDGYIFRMNSLSRCFKRSLSGRVRFVQLSFNNIEECVPYQTLHLEFLIISLYYLITIYLNT